MSEPRPRDSLQARVVTAILEAAARAMAERGDAASMGDVASEAGVARATLYRYFGNRQALEAAVVESGVARAHEGIRSGRIGEIGVEGGITRAVRALLDVGDALVVIVRRRGADPQPDVDERVAGPLRRLLHAAQATGAIRDDVPAAWLAESLMRLVATAVSSPPAEGKEDTIAAVAGFFLDGARVRLPGPSADRLPPTQAGAHDD
jgi:TetR/AcrR family transcriptional regulator, mexCD-oprJ operon repressor